MTKLLSIDGVDIIQKSFQQVLIRGDGKDQFNQIINKEISLDPPSKNLEIKINDNYIFAKNSFDQWTLVYLVEKNYKEILDFISNINSNDEILASDYSYGQVYFEITGENKDEFLNKLTQFGGLSKYTCLFLHNSGNRSGYRVSKLSNFDDAIFD